MRKFIVLLILIANAPGSFGQGFETIKIEGGLISGGADAKGDVHYFKGIPFAAPPVGSLRWRAPQPVTPWTGVRSCDQFGASPMQNKPVPFLMWTEEYLIAPTPISEDCLYLNVWSGARTTKERRPVLVWIYGGGFGSGGGNVPIYDGTAMARKGIIFVSINYRVGIFGFFSDLELSRESGHHASGNYGLMDQIAALKWVRNNIAAFGGDPNNVTIAGQSAGSMSVNCLVASPLAKGLFQKAIGESGGFFSRDMQSLAQAEESGQKLMQTLGATSLEAMRTLPSEELLKKGAALHTFPVVDNYVLPEQVADIFAAGKENPVSLLTGWNEDEGFVFGPAKKAAGFREDIGKEYGAAAATALKYYPADNDSIAGVSQVFLSRDMIFGRQNYAWANITSTQGHRVFVYRFVRQPPTAPGGRKWGAFHTAEVPYAYDNLQFVQRPWEPADYNLADEMSSYWANFVKTGDPNGVGLPQWPVYTAKDPQIMVFGRQPAAAMLPDKAALDFQLGRMSGR
ncbi:MAG TPA: carboxylesterase family protein [Puia sp.]|nr:carboxylesterase family protein [Puia sp.]